MNGLYWCWYFRRNCQMHVGKPSRRTGIRRTICKQSFVAIAPVRASETGTRRVIVPPARVTRRNSPSTSRNQLGSGAEIRYVPPNGRLVTTASTTPSAKGSCRASASSTVAAGALTRAASTATGSLSDPTARRPRLNASRRIVPLPQNGSSNVAPGGRFADVTIAPATDGRSAAMRSISRGARCRIDASVSRMPDRKSPGLVSNTQISSSAGSAGSHFGRCRLNSPTSASRNCVRRYLRSERTRVTTRYRMRGWRRRT